MGSMAAVGIPTSDHALLASGRCRTELIGILFSTRFAIRLSSSAEEQSPGFALRSALFLFQPAALISLRHCRLSSVKRMQYGLSNMLKREAREGRQGSMTADQGGGVLNLSDEMAQMG